MAKSFAWSFSALTRFEQCPKQYYHLNLRKDFKDEDSEWSLDGQVIHDAMHKRVIKGTPLPLPLRPHEKVAGKFAAAEGEKHGEMKLALNRKFEPVDFFANDVWVRGIVDLLVIRDTTGIVVDWKTGKQKPGFDQLLLTAAIVKQYMPELTAFQLVYVWLKPGTISTTGANDSALRSTWNKFLPRVSAIEAAIQTTSFPAKPSGLCRYCPVRSCPNWKPRD